jgi:hypothetical protein
VPKDDCFQVITEHDAENLVFDPTYLDIHRSEDLVIIQITWNEGRTVDQKRRSTRRSPTGSRHGSVCARRTFSSAWSRSGGRTGRSATASRNTPLDACVTEKGANSFALRAQFVRMARAIHSQMR